MNKSKKILFFSLLIFDVLLTAMEERPRNKPLPFLVPKIWSEALEKNVVNIELMDGNKVIYAIQVPYSFAQESSVLRDNLAFQEEEEGQKLTIQIPISSVTLEQLKTLEIFTHEYYLSGNLQQTVKELAEDWYPDSLNNLIDLAVVADYIGNGALLRKNIKILNKMLKRLSHEHRWSTVFKLVNNTSSSELRTLLEKKVKKNNVIRFFINGFYTLKFEKKQDRFDIVAGKKWLCAALANKSHPQYDLKGVSSVQIIDLDTLKSIAAFDVIGNGDYQISPVEDILLGNSRNEFAYNYNIYSLPMGERIASLPFDNITSVNISADGKLIVVGTSAGHLYILDAYTLEVKKQWSVNASSETHPHEVRPHLITISADEKFIAFRKSGAAGPFKDSIEVWDIKKEIKYKKFIVDGPIECLLFSPDSSHIAYGAKSNEVKIFNLYDENEPIFVQIGDKENFNYIPQLAFSPDSKLLALGFFNYSLKLPNHEIKIWDYKNNKIKRTYTIGSQGVKALGFSSDGEQLACAARRGQEPYISTIFIFDPRLENLSLSSLVLLWYFSDQLKHQQPVILPQGYSEAFLELPKKIRKYFYEKAIAAGQPPTALPFIYPYLKPSSSQEPAVHYLKETKRKKPEEKESGKGKEKKKSIHKRFKWD